MSTNGLYIKVTRNYTTCAYCLIVLGPGELKIKAENSAIHFCSEDCFHRAIKNGPRGQEPEMDGLTRLQLIEIKSINCRRVAGPLPMESCYFLRMSEECWCPEAEAVQDFTDYIQSRIDTIISKK